MLDENQTQADFGIGVFSPQFTLRNYTSQPAQAMLLAAVYYNNALEQLAAQDVLLSASQKPQTYNLSGKLNVTDAVGRSYKLFAVKNLSNIQPLPKESIGTVDNKFSPVLHAKPLH